MKRTEEWDDFLGVHVRVSPRPRRRKFYRTIDYHRRGSGWNSPGVRKAVDIYWKTTVVIIKMLLAIPLSILAIGAWWLFGIIVAIMLGLV
jgi:hypothetical protein